MFNFEVTFKTLCFTLQDCQTSVLLKRAISFNITKPSKSKPSTCPYIRSKKNSPHSSPPLPLIPSRIHNQGCRQLSNKFRLQLHSRNTRHRTRIHRRSLLDRNGGRQTRYCDRLGGERDLCLLSASSTLFSTTDNVVRILLEIGVLRWEIRKGGNRDLQCLALR